MLFRHLCGTDGLGLFFSRSATRKLVGYADAGYLSDPHHGRSQTGYVFLCGGEAISWRSVKQSMVATSSNHAEILALHEASGECVWLRSLISHFELSCGVTDSPSLPPTRIYQDNADCVYQLQNGYIKSDRTKHIAPKFFYTSELHGKEINITTISSTNNIADIFTKSLPASTHTRLVKLPGRRRIEEVLHQGEKQT